jgi:hypothetical protein
VANELSITIKASFAKGGTEVVFPDAAKQSFQVTVSGSRFIQMRQSVGTSEEALDIGDIATGGYFIAVNRDATNYVEIRSGTGATDLVRLNAGEVCMFRMSADSSAPYAIANTASVDLEYILIAA